MSDSGRQVGDCEHGRCRLRCVECLRLQVLDAHDAIRLMIGRQCNIPWRDVPQTEVQAFLDTIRAYKDQKETAVQP